MDIKEFYESMYKYDQRDQPRGSLIYRKLKRFECNRYDQILENMPIGGRLLDIGCGEGELLFSLENYFDELHGLDIAESRIGRVKAKIKNKKNIFVHLGNANERLPFEDGYFNIILASDVLEHLFDPYYFVRECSRMLRKQGTLMLHVPNIAYLPRRLNLLFGQFPTTSDEVGWDGGHLHYFTRSSMRKLLEIEGYNNIRITSGGIFPNLRRFWGSLLCEDILIIGVKK